MGRNIPVKGGGQIAAASGTSSVVDTNATGAARCLVVSSAAALIGDFSTLGATSGATALTAANATFLAANIEYEFDLFSARYIHVAGNGGAATITVTLTT